MSLAPNPFHGSKKMTTMSYFEDAKHTCPLCGSPMTAAVDPAGEVWSSETDQHRWDVHRCTSPVCGIMWSYGDILGEENDHTRVIEIDNKVPWDKDARSTLRVEWSKNDFVPLGQVEATLTGRRRRFQRKPTPMHLKIQAASLAAGDRDSALREAFSLWRLRAFA